MVSPCGLQLSVAKPGFVAERSLPVLGLVFFHLPSTGSGHTERAVTLRTHVVQMPRMNRCNLDVGEIATFAVKSRRVEG